MCKGANRKIAMDIRLRAATPGDSRGLAELMYLAAKSQYENSGYDISLGGSYEHQLAQIGALTVTTAPSWFHHSHFVVIESHGTIVACAAGFDRIPAEAAIPNALREIGWTRDAIETLGVRLELLYAAFPEEPAGYWTIDHVAVIPTHRGIGLGRKVLENVVQRGVGLGFTDFKLDVFSGNVTATRLYEALGFQVSEVFGCDTLRASMGRDAIERMTLHIPESDNRAAV
jgi:ribosomal protein S18 acetylase RimI-like enzyme